MAIGLGGARSCRHNTRVDSPAPTKTNALVNRITGWRRMLVWPLGLLVRIARLPRDALAAKAQAVFEAHFSEVFAGLDTARLGYPVEQLVDLVKWLLAKTRKDVLRAIEGGSSPEEVRAAYLSEWAFFCSVLAGGIYRPVAPA